MATRGTKRKSPSTSVTSGNIDSKRAKVAVAVNAKDSKARPATRSQQLPSTTFQSLQTLKRSTKFVNLRIDPFNVTSQFPCVNRNGNNGNGKCKCVQWPSDYWHFRIRGWEEMIISQDSKIRMEIVDSHGVTLDLSSINVRWAQVREFTIVRSEHHSFADCPFDANNPTRKTVTFETTGTDHTCFYYGVPAMFQVIRFYKTVTSHSRTKRPFATTRKQLIDELKFEDLDPLWVIAHDSTVRAFGLAPLLPFSSSLLRLVASYIRC